MTLEELLKRFDGPKAAAQAAGLSRTAGYPWYERGEKRVLPAIGAIIKMANTLELTNEELGILVRDVEEVRKGIHRKQRRRPVRKRERDIEAKEEFLRREARKLRLQEIQTEIYKRW